MKIAPIERARTRAYERLHLNCRNRDDYYVMALIEELCTEIVELRAEINQLRTSNEEKKS